MLQFFITLFSTILHSHTRAHTHANIKRQTLAAHGFESNNRRNVNNVISKHAKNASIKPNAWNEDETKTHNFLAKKAEFYSLRWFDGGDVDQIS